MDVLIPDYVIYMGLGVIAVLGLWFFITIVWGSNYLFNKAKAVFKKEVLCLQGLSGGGGQFTTRKRERGFLVNDKEEIEIGDRTVTRMKNNTDMFLIHDKLGVTVSLEVASAIAQLDFLGYKELSQAIAAYDTEWLKANRDKVDEMLSAAKNEKDREIILTEISKKGDDVLLRLQWINKRTIPLSIVYNWAYQVLNPQNNKILTEQGKLDVLQEKVGGMTAQKMMPWIIMGILVIGAITFALVVLNGQGLLGNGGGTANTVTTIAQTATTIAQSTTATTLKAITAPTIPTVFIGK